VSGAGSTTASILLWGAVLIAAFVGLGTVAWLVRRWLFSAAQNRDEGAWSLQHLRDMKVQGRITEEEFEALKRQALEACRSTAEKQESARSAGHRGPR